MNTATKYTASPLFKRKNTGEKQRSAAVIACYKKEKHCIAKTSEKKSRKVQTWYDASSPFPCKARLGAKRLETHR